MRLAGSYDLHVSAMGDDDGSEWDAFLTTMPRVAYQQSSSWAKVKASQGWRSARVTLTRDGSIHAGAQLLYQSIPLAGTIGFVTRGPVLASHEPTLSMAAAGALERLAAIHDVRYLVVQPPKERDEVVTPRLLRSGYRTAPEIMAPHNTTTRVLDLSHGTEAILASMRKSARRSVRLSQQRGLTIREGSMADLPVFHSLLAATARRRGFSPPPISFFEAAWSAMAPAGMLRMGVAEVAGEPVSASLWVAFGDTMNCWRSGWSGEHSYRRPNTGLDWVGIRWAAERGLRWYDFQSDSDYMRGFGGSRVTSPGPLERVMNPALRWLYPRAFHRVVGTRYVSRLKQVVRSRGLPGSVR